VSRDLARFLVLTGAHGVVEVRCCQDQRANDCECPIGGQPKLRMGHGSADNEYEHTQDTRQYYPGASVVAKTEPQCDDTEWQDQEQHLHVQVPLRELRKKRQTRDQKRQRQAMDQAQCG